MTKRPHLQFSSQTAGLVACVILCLVTAACSEKKLPDGFAPAYGTVTLDGSPIKDAEVIFQTEKGESYGRTDANGKYTMERTRTQSGAGLGPATVRISTRAVFDDMSEEGLEIDQVTEDPVREETIPAHYRNGIEIEVTPDGAPYDFELTSTPPAGADESADAEPDDE